MEKPVKNQREATAMATITEAAIDLFLLYRNSGMTEEAARLKVTQDAVATAAPSGTRRTDSTAKRPN
jgi:hypothetical protein